MSKNDFDDLAFNLALFAYDHGIKDRNRQEVILISHVSNTLARTHLDDEPETAATSHTMAFSDKETDPNAEQQRGLWIGMWFPDSEKYTQQALSKDKKASKTSKKGKGKEVEKISKGDCVSRVLSKEGFEPIPTDPHALKAIVLFHRTTAVCYALIPDEEGGLSTGYKVLSDEVFYFPEFRNDGLTSYQDRLSGWNASVRQIRDEISGVHVVKSSKKNTAHEALEPSDEQLKRSIISELMEYVTMYNSTGDEKYLRNALHTIENQPGFKTCMLDTLISGGITEIKGATKAYTEFISTEPDLSDAKLITPERLLLISKLIAYHKIVIRPELRRQIIVALCYNLDDDFDMENGEEVERFGPTFKQVVGKVEFLVGPAKTLLAVASQPRLRSKYGTLTIVTDSKTVLARPTNARFWNWKMPFSSLQNDILLPRDITVWEWLFEHPTYSPLHRYPENQQAGFVDATTKERLSWKDVKDAATCLSTILVKKYGLKCGDTVSLFSQNTIWYPVAMHATVRVGGVISGASPAYNVDEMTYALQKADAKFLMTHPASMKVAIVAAKNAGIPQDRIFLLDGQMKGFKNVKELIEEGRREGKEVPYYRIPKGKTNMDVCGFLSFSSGTTGLPKAVMIAHQNVIAQCLQVMQITPSDHKTVLAVLPSFHITGLVHSLHLPILINAEVVMLPAFTMKSMLDATVEYRIKEILLVPPILIRMVRDPIVDKYDLSFIRRFSSGAAPVSEEIIQLLKAKFPNAGFKQGYGMTESCSCITAHPTYLYDFKYAHTVGTICASTTVKILKEGGQEAGVGEAGEICAKGPQIVMGYLNNEQATKETFDEDGYLHTGDQGSIDENGIITILDRIKELIKVKGIGVAPAELEDLLLGHPKVEDVAIIGIPDEYSGEVPKAYVHLKPGHEASQEVGRELLQYARERKVRYKAVKEIEFIEAVPKSASGKILRRVLRDRSKKQALGMVVREERANL